MQNKWVRFLKGYLMLRLHGDYVERFFNMCRMHDILLWNIRKEGTDFCCSMAARDYLTTIPLMKKTGTRATVLKKMGLPFYAPQMRKRALFFLSLFVCLGLLYAVTGNVWALEFVGNRQISEEELQDFLAEENIFYGMKKEALNCEQIEKHLRARFPNVTWTSVYFQGTKLFVEVKENEKTEPAAQERKGRTLWRRKMERLFR